MTAVLLFAKAPRPGEVKTRLAADLGNQRAVEVYRALGVRVARQVSRAYPLTVWYDPPDALGEMRSWLGNYEYQAQGGGDLGDRLTHAFTAHFARGDAPVVAIGADAPGVGADTVAAAARALDGADVVLGPALDGGYYLVGLTRLTPAIFTNVPWGTSQVLASTLERCREAGLAVSQLKRLRDVDTAQDLDVFGLLRP